MYALSDAELNNEDAKKNKARVEKDPPGERKEPGSQVKQVTDAIATTVMPFLPASGYASLGYDAWANGEGFLTGLGYFGLAAIEDAAYIATGQMTGAIINSLKNLLAAGKGTTSIFNDLVKAAQAQYPGKAGKIQLHHPIPQYLGGAKDQVKVPLNSAYHQVITNEFRALWPYGNELPSATQLNEIMTKVYSKFPLPQ